MVTYDFPLGSDVKVSAYNAGDSGSIPGLGRSPGEGNGWLPTPVFLPEEFHGQRKGVWWATVHGGLIESDMTEQLLLPKSEKAWDLF